MKVVFTSRFPSDRAGGIESFVREVLPRLRALRPAWDVENVYAFGAPGKLNGLPLAGDLVAAVLLAVRCRGADVVVVNGAEYAWPRALRRRWRRTSLVVWHGTRAGEVPSLAPRLTVPIRMYWWLQVRLQAFALAIARHAVVGPNVAAELREWYGTDAAAVVIPNGAPPASTAAREPVPGRFLWIGTSPYKKGLDLALAACRIVRERAPQLTLRVVGVAGGHTHASDESWVEIAGRIAPSEMPQEYSRAQAMLATTRYEGCSMAVLEAMAYEVPVVGSAPLRWMLGDEALCSASLEPASFAAVIERALAHPGLFESARASAAKRLDDFSWSRAAAAYITLVESMDESSPPRLEHPV